VGKAQQDGVNPRVKVIAGGSSRGGVTSIRRAWGLACPECKLTSGTGAVNEVANLVEEREPLLAEGFHLGVALRRGTSVGDKYDPHICSQAYLAVVSPDAEIHLDTFLRVILANT
jgi:hypothetical protein